MKRNSKEYFSNTTQTIKNYIKADENEPFSPEKYYKFNDTPVEIARSLWKDLVAVFSPVDVKAIADILSGIAAASVNREHCELTEMVFQLSHQLKDAAYRFEHKTDGADDDDDDGDQWHKELPPDVTLDDLFPDVEIDHEELGIFPGDLDE